MKYLDQRFVNRLCKLHSQELNKNSCDFRKGGEYFRYLSKVHSHLFKIRHTIF